jgi:hypothetical protein
MFVIILILNAQLSDRGRRLKVNQTCEPKAIGSLPIEVINQSNEKSTFYNIPNDACLFLST